jgi:hypothetical protein
MVKKYLIKLLIFSILYFAKVYLLWQSGLYDFDVLKNYLVVLKIEWGGKNFNGKLYKT